MSLADSPLLTAFTDPSFLFSVTLSLKVAVATLVIHTLLAPMLAWALARPGWPGRAWLDVLITLPMVFPPIVLGFLLLLILGREGWIGQALNQTFGFSFIFSPWGVLLASVIVGLPLVVKPLAVALATLPPSLAEAARTLGHGEWSLFLRVLLPNVRGVLASGLLLAAARSLGEVGATLMLGGNIVGRTDTVSLDIYNAVMQGDFPRATALSALLGLFSILVLFALRMKGTDHV